MSKFDDMEESLEKKGYSDDSAAKITAAAGDKKYGTKVMSKASQAGVSAEAIKRRMARGMKTG